jgi:hypothetical protein
MRALDPTGPPTTSPPTPSEADLVALTTRLATGLTPRPTTRPEGRPATLPATGPATGPATRPATQPTTGPATQPAPATAGPLTGRVADPGEGVLRLSTAPADRVWAVRLLVAEEVEAWLVGWPAGRMSGVHEHGGVAEAVTVVEGALGEECLDPTIWTTSRRTTWRAGTSTLFPAGHVHLLGAAGGRPAVTVHAWSGAAASAGRAAGRSALAGRRGPTAGRGPGGGGDPVGIGLGRGGGGACLLAGQPAHGALDLGHVRDRVAG